MRPTSARLTVSADVLSPEKGSCRFTHQMLRQVAYDTLSRRDRKARHLAVAAHLRAAFPVDSEEVAEVIARHYLDALVETATTADLLALLDRYRPGQLAPMQRAERDLAHASLAAADGGPGSGLGD